MSAVKRALVYLILVPVVVLTGVNIVRLIVQPNPTLPRPSDVARAQRTLVSQAHADTAERMPLAGSIGGSGVIEPAHREVRVATQVAGRVAKVWVEEGQRVEVGARLVSLEDAVEQAGVRAATAQVARARAELSRVTKGSRYEDVRAASADAKAARARAQLSRGILTRTTQLAESGGATPDALDRARHQADVDREAAKAAEARRLAVSNGSRPEDVAATEADLEVAEAKLEQAVAQRDRLRIDAPIAGEILQIKVRAGELAQPAGDPVIIIGDTRVLRARMDVDERDVGDLKLGAKAVIRAPAWPDRDFAARVVEVGHRMGRKNVRTDDPAELNDTRILEVVVAIEASDGLVVGQRVTGFIDRP